MFSGSLEQLSLLSPGGERERGGPGTFLSYFQMNILELTESFGPLWTWPSLNQSLWLWEWSVLIDLTQVMCSTPVSGVIVASLKIHRLGSERVASNEGILTSFYLRVVDADKCVFYSQVIDSLLPCYLYPVSTWTILSMHSFILLRIFILSQIQTLLVKLHKLCLYVLNLLLCMGHNDRDLVCQLLSFLPAPSTCSVNAYWQK